MPQDETPSPDPTAAPDPANAPAPAEDTPEIEDAYAPVEPTPEARLVEDDTDLLDPSARAIEADPAQGDDLDEASVAATVARSAQVAQKDDTSDADSAPGEPETAAQEATESELPDWGNERSTHKIVVELKRIESEIRQLLEARDTKRKRKLGGTRRWSELEEDILSWRYAGRIDEPTLARLQELIARRHHLFHRLRFLASTRATWNT